MQPITIAPTFDGKRTVPSPRVTDIMLELLDLKPSDKVMEIGTGSGYQTSRLADTGAEIHSIELEPWIDTTQVTGEYIFLHTGDGINGIPAQAPFTAIVATCGVESIPKAWTQQLAEGGRLIAPIGEPSSQRLTLFRKQNGELIPIRIGAYVRFSMMREQPKPKPPKYQPDGQFQTI